MKRILVCLLILTLLCAIPLSMSGCKKTGAEVLKLSKYKQKIDLSEYKLVFCDEFEGELNRDVWGDTRQGTRRDGYWTKNLAYTDGEGHLIIRTEQRGSRWSSDTHTRQVAGYNDSTITVKYDNGNPFGVVAGDFGAATAITLDTNDMIGDDIVNEFNTLGETFGSFIGAYDTAADTATYYSVIGKEAQSGYATFFNTATQLYSYYCFVREIKSVASSREASAVIGVTSPYAITFGADVTTQTVDLRNAMARLYGFSSDAEFVSYAQSLVALCKNPNGAQAALKNGGFLTTSNAYIFPVAIQSGEKIILTYVIVEGSGRVSIWVNDLTAALQAVNYSADCFTSATVTNEMYTKNILFVTGPTGVYSGALRTRNKYTHGYGYYEIRCKLPSVEGIWHAFWLMCGDVYSVENGSADGVEIDIFEYLPARDALNEALHWDGYDEDHKNVYKRFEKTGFADGEYHTFGMNWDENGYAFYLDGRKVWTTKGDGVCNQEGYMKISTEYGEWGDWVGDLTLTDLPVDWVIDYVKIYDKK